MDFVRGTSFKRLGSRGGRWSALLLAGLCFGLAATACGQSVGAGDDGGADATLPDATLPDGGAVDAATQFTDPDAAGPLTTGAPQWAMLGATPQRTGRSAFVGPSQVTETVVDLRASADEHELVMVGAVGPAGTVYAVVRAPNELGRLVALQPDGTVRWQSPPVLMGGVALDGDGTLLVEGFVWNDPQAPVRFAPALYAVGTNGVLDWTGLAPGAGTSNPESHHSAPLQDSQGNRYVILPLWSATDLADGFHLCSFDPAGALRWCWDRLVARENPGLAFVNPALGPNDTLYAVVETEDLNEPSGPESTDGVYALDTDGAEQWFLPLPDMHVTNIALTDDATVIYAAFTDQTVFVGAVQATGAKGWANSYPERYQSVSAGLAITSSDAPEPTIYVAGWHDLDAGGSEGSITALSLSGAERWVVQTEGVPCGGLAVDATGAVYGAIWSTVQGGGVPHLLGLEPDGTTRLSVPLSPFHPPYGCLFVEVTPVTTAVVLADEGRIYLGSWDGFLHILSPQ